MRTFLFVAALIVGACISETTLAQGRGGGGRGGSGLGCGGRGSMTTGGLAGISRGGGIDSMSPGASASVSAARLGQQLQMAYLQQAYLAQVQATLVRQQASAARKAEMKERQLAGRRARREVELARRSTNSSPTNISNGANSLASSLK
jgi:hypothetical protein